MANTRELRRRIKSVKNISQITRAMQMVAATKMRRAQSQALAGRPYLQILRETIKRLADKSPGEIHPLLQSNDSEQVGIILLSTDKSLCGALNTNLFRAIINFSRDKKGIFYTIGKKGRSFIVKTGKTLEADFYNPERVSFSQAKQLAKLVMTDFISGKVSEIYLTFPKFISTLRQEATVTKLLPMTLEMLEELEKQTQEESKISDQEYLIEPNPAELLDEILIHGLQTQIYSALLETKASEHSARMMAMQNATDNAKELVEDLNLTYNQTRQAAITNELLEITSAQSALE